MPLPDPRAGSLYIWVTTLLLLLAIVGGGVCLLLYILLPEGESPSWLPILGVLLVCLPWLFWLLTIFYRVFSRTCGFRIGPLGNNPNANANGNQPRGGAAAGGSVAAASLHNSVKDGASETCAPVSASSPVTSPGGTARRVHFGAAVVVGEEESEDSLQKKENRLSSSNSSNDISIDSHESEMPLTLCMAS